MDNLFDTYVFLQKIQSFRFISRKPKSIFPKRNIDKVTKWAKLDIFDLEHDNLSKHLDLEKERINKMYSYNEKDLKNINYIIDQI